MTYAAIPALRVDDAIAKEWTPKLAARTYDPGAAPARGEVRRPRRHGDDREAGRLRRPRQRDARRRRPRSTASTPSHGHKWFTSAPMNDVFLVLAQAPGGMSCFLVPRVLPSGERNRLDVVRLKDKLGNRSNASSELEFHGTWAQRLGDEGRGVRTIIEMVAATRLDCVLGSAVADAQRPGRGVVARRAPLGVRRPARRQAADAERDRRPRRRVRGRDRRWRSGSPRPSTTATDAARGGASAGSPCRSRSSGSASARR